VSQLTDRIRIHYQPIIRLADLRVDSVEVLVRSIDSNGNLSGPELIVDAMTASDISMTLTKNILQHALAEHAAHGFADLNISFAFNLPLDAMLHPDLISIIDVVRRENGIPVNNICFELTERHPVNNIAGLGAVILSLLHAGYGLALDDITPAMRNLDALLKLPIRAVKLDRSVVTLNNAANRAFISRIVAQGAAAGTKIIAEGIETAATLKRLQRLGVTHVQGFIFARPLPADELRAFLAKG
jgi:EAL domain-containing protein (putative c-di-GMP-specific phosphodiesterase class I)